MPFIRTQKLVYDDSGKIVSGSASIVDVSYVAGAEKYKSKQTVRERLGKVVELYGTRRGLFQSPTRGLVIYDADTDSFSYRSARDDIEQQAKEAGAQNESGKTAEPVVPETDLTDAQDASQYSDIFPEEDVHTVFGDAYLLIEVMKKIGIWQTISDLFPAAADKQRVLCHVLYSLLEEGSRISCEDFAAKSFVAYCIRDVPLRSLSSDTRYFAMMGEDRTRTGFFSSYVKLMRERNEGFGNACYVDATSLPNSIDSPFNALCSREPDAVPVQMRLALVLDETTLYPVWYDLIPGNLPDISALCTVAKDVEISLDFQLKNYTLDACYATKELIQSFEMQRTEDPAPEKRFLARMPAKKGFPYRELYNEMKDSFWKPKYCFLRNGRAYFGRDVRKTIFGKEINCCVFVDKYEALKAHAKYMTDHPDEYEKLALREQEWLQVEGGYFVLAGNCIKTPARILDDYFAKTRVENFFRNAGDYLTLLPLEEWKDDTVRGKILSDVIVAIAKQELMRLCRSGKLSLSSVLGKCQSLMCARDAKTSRIYVESPNPQVRMCYENFGISVPREIDLEAYLRQLYSKS